MSIFTLSPDLLENIEDDEKIYITDILFVFTQRGSLYKVAKDTNGEILDIYRTIQNNADFIKQWLELMSYKPAKFENIDADLSQIKCVESKFVELCSRTNSTKQMIVYSKQNLKKHTCINNIVEYNNHNILILDRDDANNMLNNKNVVTNNYSHSQIAVNGSSINDSTN